MSVLLAGLPDAVPAYTVNRLCASGMTAIVQAAQAIRAGDADVVIAGGVESMTRAPWVQAKPAKPWGGPGSPSTRRSDGGSPTRDCSPATKRRIR
ncbi:hypothetical protein GCM10025881_14290 [Pseudolysinimonas kribbensis]|uniref:acetyl-CoA C-acetyltransferase n=1 Tax=Pseudolysinimonas kribbensis TaxID=433641 RepID=A0ABQ6K1X7_9MICO|nr:hypothetical protein GCM10025881_14290 [Pseudolysinimonas kribbensis]